MKTTLRLSAIALLSLPTLAVADGVNLSGRFSTLGLGAEVGYAFNEYVNIRVASNNYSYDYDTTEDDINYNFDLDLKSTAVFLDVHPFGGTFRITAGMLDNKNELNGQAEAAGTYEINGVNYQGSDVGTLFSNVKLGEDNPLYVGLGWSKALSDSGWGLGFDLGMVMLGDSEVDLTATGPITMDPNFAADIAAEEEEVEAEINSDFEAYPVIALGITFQF